MQWTDQIRRVKIVLVAAAVVIAVASLWVSHLLTHDLSDEEHSRMAVWAEAMRTLNNADDETDMTLVLSVINSNHTIPVIVLDPQGEAETFRNLNVPGARTMADTLAFASRTGQAWLAAGRSIRISLNEASAEDYIDVCYDDSLMLRRLSYYPFIQLGVVMLFVAVAIFALLTSKRAEQNKVWVGLSKETAHQLGTPTSSLMAWIEILKETYPDDALIPEMDKDVERLQLIADRFSKIGSLPEPERSDVGEAVRRVAEYMDRRTSRKVVISCHLPEQPAEAMLCTQLFEWVVENLCKNAVDAMSGQGSIDITVDVQDQRVAIEVADTGKGIRKKDLRSVFSPGFTTKKRGWGLGLSLAKRIVEEYHHGRIWVKHSELGRGTTFRIEIPRG